MNKQSNNRTELLVGRYHKYIILSSLKHCRLLLECALESCQNNVSNRYIDMICCYTYNVLPIQIVQKHCITAFLTIEIIFQYHDT